MKILTFLDKLAKWKYIIPTGAIGLLGYLLPDLGVQNYPAWLENFSGFLFWLAGGLAIYWLWRHGDELGKK